MLELVNLSKAFDKKVVLDGVSLHMPTGQKTTLIGASGSGKSTILKIILGLIPVDSGDILVNGQSMLTLSKEELYQLRSNFSLLFQSGALFDSMTVEENVSFILRESKNSLKEAEIRYKVDHALDLVGMKGYNAHMPNELSGGQMKRIGLARAIVNRPKYLFFDEPTTGLDPVLSTNIEDLIVDISKEFGTTTIVVSHQITTILRTSDFIYMLHKGKLLEPETPDTIFESENKLISSFVKGKEYVAK
jgi:phospholipid/cholesterol/gamma-HCH transport system ATP-binding protein